MQHVTVITSETPTLRSIGRIARLQVAPRSLKSGVYPDESYDPGLLVAVQALLLTPKGVIGVDDAGGPILDVHHADHPQARRWGSDNGVSLGFSSHYQTMRQQFGPHLADGVGGENLIVASDQHWTAADLAGGLFIASQNGDELVALGRAQVATPCVPFARFTTGNPELRGPAMKAALQSLNHGTRGFYVALLAPLPVALIRLGDEILVPEPPAQG